jgi:hypothetical protein
VGDLGLVESIHALVRVELGAVDFGSFVACPSTITTANEQAALLAELSSAIEALTQGTEVRLHEWLRFRHRWWLDSEWQLDSESVVTAFGLLEQYQRLWSNELVGRRRRMQDWSTKHWSHDVGRRAMASLARDASLSGETNS